MLTLVTHTKTVWARDITRCVKSVEKAIDGLTEVKHLVIPDRRTSTGFESFARLRYTAKDLDQYIAFIDDDDYISEDSIKTLLKYLKQRPELGIVYSSEITLTDETFSNNASEIAHYTYESIIEKQPTNLCIINTKYITDRSLELSIKHKLRIENVMKLEAALEGGALYVQVNGYFHTVDHHSRLDKYPSFKVNNDLRDFFITDKYNGPIEMIRP